MHDPLEIVALVVAQEKVRKQFEPAPVRSGTKPADASARLGSSVRSRLAGRLRGLADRLEPAGLGVGTGIRS